MEHSELSLDQFTRQAVPFATASSIKDEAALRLIVELSGAGPDDTVLDVACGPGLVVCAFARVVRHATGIDVTPAMLDQARTHAAARGGTVMVVDSSPAAAKATAFNRMETRSSPEPGDADRVRAIFADSLADDPLDMQVRREADRIVFGGYPVAALAARRG
jgi:SAM-dependent methyltransferase